MTFPDKPVIAVCGKGGVGKTVVSALVSRALLDLGVAPLLLVDADPVGGLVLAIGEPTSRTLADVRATIIESVSRSREPRDWVARRLDYLLLETLEERDDHSVLAIGRTQERGCYCPINRLLRQALDLLIEPFRAVIVDGEAGLEQINREVTEKVTQVVVVIDGSYRSLHTLGQIVELVPASRVSAVANRGGALAELDGLPEGVELIGAIPEDEAVRELDRLGRSLWELPASNPTMEAARELARALSFTSEPGGL